MDIGNSKNYLGISVITTMNQDMHFVGYHVAERGAVSGEFQRTKFGRPLDLANASFLKIK